MKQKAATTYKGTIRRAVAAAQRTGSTYYIRPVVDRKDEFCMSDVRPDAFTVAVMPSLSGDKYSIEVRNMENWPVELDEWTKVPVQSCAS